MMMHSNQDKLMGPYKCLINRSHKSHRILFFKLQIRISSPFSIATFEQRNYKFPNFHCILLSGHKYSMTNSRRDALLGIPHKYSTERYQLK